MIARSSLFSPIRPRQSKSSRMRPNERALRLLGRFSVTTATESSVSKQRFSYLITSPFPGASSAVPSPRHTIFSNLLMPAILRIVLIVSAPLGELSAHLGKIAKVGIELEGDHALVLPVVVTEDVAPVR